MTFSNFNTISSGNPLNTAVATPVFTVFAARDPTTTDNAYQPATEWQNQVTGKFWKLVSTGASANWIALSGGSVPAALTLTGNSGGAVSPSGLGNINVVGDGTTITITGNPGTNTLTASLVGGGTAVDSFVTNIGGPVVPTGAGAINVNASTTTFTDGATANTLKTEVQATNHAVLVGQGSQIPIVSVGPSATVGLPLISAGAAADPQFAILPIAGGGTNANSFGTTNGIVKYDGTSLVASATATLDASNRLVNTAQPCFCVILTNTTAAVTGDGTTWTFGTTGGGTLVTQFDQGSNITIVSTNVTFTAPVTGKYIFYSGFDVTNISGAMTDCVFQANNATTAGFARFQKVNIGAIRNASNEASVQGAAIVNSSAGDIWTVSLQISNGALAATITGTTSFVSYWAGELLC